MRAPVGGEPGTAPRDGAFALFVIVVWFAATASSGTFGAWPAVGGAAIVLGLAAALVRPAGTRTLLRGNGRLVGLGALVGAAMIALSYLVQPRLVALVPYLADETAALYEAVRMLPPVAVALLLAPVTLGEELAWRGAVQDTLVRGLGTWTGVALTAVLYALSIAPMGSSLLVGIALAWGVTWGALRAATGSLVPPLVAHLAWSAVVVLWFPLDGAGPMA